MKIKLLHIFSSSAFSFSHYLLFHPLSFVMRGLKFYRFVLEAKIDETSIPSKLCARTQVLR